MNFKSKTAHVCISTKTDTGKVRSQNEDAFIVCSDLKAQNWYDMEALVALSSLGCLLVVVDGVGGTKAGNIASNLVIQTVKDCFFALPFSTKPSEKQAQEFILHTVQRAHQAIIGTAHENPECEGMGSTILLAWIMDHSALLAWRGDSRGYLYRHEKGISILTQDHSLVWDYVKAGKLSPQEADMHPLSHILLRSLGNPKIRLASPDFLQVSLQIGDRLLLCTDGLNGMLTIVEIEQIVSKPVMLSQICEQLITAANEKGGEDNITVAILEVIS